MGLSNMSDEELLAIAGGGETPSAPTADLSSMSDEELMKIAGEPVVRKQTEMATQMAQETGSKEDAMAKAKAIKDPAERDQAIRDAMRLGTMTEGEANSEQQEANEFIATNQSPIKLKSGEIAKPFSVDEAGIEPTLVTLDLVTAGLRSKGIKTAVGMYDEITKGFLERGEYSDVVNTAVRKYAQRKGVSDTKLDEILHGVPTNKQALRISNYLGEESSGVLRQAIKHSDDLKLSMNRLIKKRIKDIEAVADIKNIYEYDKVAKQGFTDMVEKVSSMNIGVDATDVTKGIDTTKILGGKDDALKSKIDSLTKIIADRPNQQLSDLLNIQKEINDLMDSSSSGTGMYMLQKLKSNLAKTIDNATPAELSDVMNTARHNFASAKQNIKLAETIQASKDQNGVINYANLKQKLVDDKTLNTYETKATINILEQFDTKFNSDYRVFGHAAGTSLDGGALGAIGVALAPIKEFVIRWGEFGNNVAMQKQIAATLKESKSPLEFVSKIVRNKKTPEEMRQVMLNKLTKLDKTDLSALEIKELNIINTDLVRDLKKSELALRGKKQVISKAEYRLEKLQTQLITAQKKKDTKGSVIYDLQERVRLAEEDVVLANQRHDLDEEAVSVLRNQVEGTKSSMFDEMNNDLDEMMEKFKPGKKTTGVLGAAGSANAAGINYNEDDNRTVHTIKQGDTAEGIAKMYNISQAEVEKQFGNGQIGAKINITPQGYPAKGFVMPDVVKRQEAEGNEEMILKPHKPTKESGVTVGYGYDIKTKSLSTIKSDFELAGIPVDKAIKLHNGKDMELTPREAASLANVSWMNAYRKGTRIGLPLNNMPPKARDKVISLLYRGDIVKGSSSYRGDLYKLAKKGDIKKIDELAMSDKAPEVLRNRWSKYEEG